MEFVDREIEVPVVEVIEKVVERPSAIPLVVHVDKILEVPQVVYEDEVVEEGKWRTRFAQKLSRTRMDLEQQSVRWPALAL